MHFPTSLVSLVASAAVASAGTVTFWTLDDVERTLYFTSNSAVGGGMDPVTVDSSENKTVTFPDGFIGNFYAIPKGEENVPGMLGEVNFAGWNGLTYFDVSAIVKPEDHNNVKQMWPKGSKEPMSGCAHFPCNNCYQLPDDVQTKTTEESDLWTTLGEGETGLF